MPTPKPKATPKAKSSVEERLLALETRMDALESKKCEAWEKVKTSVKELNIPNQKEIKDFIRENPFLALGIAVLGTILLISIF